MILNDMEKMKSITNNFIENLNTNEEGINIYIITDCNKFASYKQQIC